MKKKKTKFIFTYNELLEFQYTLASIAYYLNNENEIYEIVGKIKQNDYVEKGKQVMSLLSDYMKSEILYFFSNGNNICDGLGQIILYYNINNKELNSIEQLYNTINESSDEELIGVILTHYYYDANNEAIDKSYDIESLVFNYEKVHQLAIDLEFENENKKNVFMSFIENVGECKQRLALLLKVFYDKVYKKVFSDSYEIVKPYIKLYEDELTADEKTFFHKYMVCDSDIYGDEIYIDVSYIRINGGDFWSSQTNRREWIILGCYSNEVISYNNERDKLFEFLKVIGEKKRIQIIELLRKSPSYVDEIAVNMQMTASTASYHLTQLQTFDIVDYERYDHRFYYHLNNDMLVMWLDKAKKYFEK